MKRTTKLKAKKAITRKVNRGASSDSLERMVRLPSHKFTFHNSADSNRVFLFRSTENGVKPIQGWKIVGYGQAPWPGTTEGFAAMFEKVAPAKERRSIFGGNGDEGFVEGTRIWQHYRKRWLEEAQLRLERPPMKAPELDAALGAVRSETWLDSDCVKAAASGAAVASQRRQGCDYSEYVSRNIFFPRPNESKGAFSGNSEKSIW